MLNKTYSPVSQASQILPTAIFHLLSRRELFCTIAMAAKNLQETRLGFLDRMAGSGLRVAGTSKQAIEQKKRQEENASDKNTKPISMLMVLLCL